MRAEPAVHACLLQNSTHGLRIGCVVNDVAAVNVDAKLVRGVRGGRSNGRTTTAADLTDTVELANGCACCSLQDELFSSFEALLALSDERGMPYDRLILENSGVAEPHNIRDLFYDAALVGLPITKRIRLDTMVTVVDSASFLADYSTRAPVGLRPDLGEGGGLRPVVDLLVEQLECADYVLLNKMDLMPEGQLASLQAVVSSINPLASVIACRDGAVSTDQVFGCKARALVANLNIEAQHRGAVAAALADASDDAQPTKKPKTAHGDHNEADSASCKQEKYDAEHSNSTGHGDKHSHEHGDKHSHKHGHNHDHDRDHDHDHGHDHDHDHSHNHGDRQETTAAARFGIRSFVYSRRQPFHPQRLQNTVLRWLPATSIKTANGTSVAPAAGDSAFKTVLRSKGFMWLSHNHATAFYWSHAGQHFEIRDEGDWWAAVPRSEWPQNPKQHATVLSDFDTSGPWGDRRQEIIFIGAKMEQAAIETQLDAALVTDAEMAAYADNWKAQPDPPVHG